MTLIGSDIYKLIVLFTTFVVFVSTLDTNSTFTNSSGKVDHDVNQYKLPTKPTNLAVNNLNITINKEQGDPSKEQVMTNKNKLPFTIEGENVPQQEERNLDPEHYESINSYNNHSKGVIKGRKGAGQYPGSTVGRKGVKEQDAHSNKSSVNIPPNESVTVMDILHKQSVVNTEQSFTTVIPNLESKPVHKDKISQNNSIHVKKPEVLSDDGDAGEFGKYSMLKPSTTGEDYVIIGIVIVIGIWFAVFGALIFYRRAGEYWDRRHYRRMDFLVEGMYND